MLDHQLTAQERLGHGQIPAAATKRLQKKHRPRRNDLQSLPRLSQADTLLDEPESGAMNMATSDLHL